MTCPLRTALSGSVAIAWVILDEPYAIPSSYLGWFVSLPLLVVVSLLTKHSPSEDLDMF